MTKKIHEYDIEIHKNGNPVLDDENRKRMRNALNDKGPGFCLAKWTQVTMHLGVGLTHSCHHPVAHKIPLEELKDNPSALHNTGFKKEQRKAMLNGQRPSECDYCWRIEDADNISDRVLKSMDNYSFSQFDSIANSTGDEEVYPKYVEVSFSNVCNFKCSYCGPTFSSKWAEEIKKDGPYELENGSAFNWTKDVPLKASEDNPYTDAFWKWYPEAVKHMHTFRITGGEPLLSKHTLKTLQFLIDNPQPNLEIAINSNACPPNNLWEEFTSVVNKLLSTKSIKRFTLFVSAESVNKQAEYSRRGMDWNLFTRNVEYFLQNTVNTRVTFMAAFNIFSITTINEFLEYILYLKKKYNRDSLHNWVTEKGLQPAPILKANLNNDRDIEFNSTSSKLDRVGIDIPYVRSPDFLDPHIVTLPLIQKYMYPAVNFMYENIANGEWASSNTFETWEALKLKRIFVDMLIHCSDRRNEDDTTKHTEIAKKRARFYSFIKEYDARSNSNFSETFPGLVEFYNVCKLEHDVLKSD